MGTRKRLFLSVVFLGALSGATSAQTQTPDQAPPQTAAAPAQTQTPDQAPPQAPVTAAPSAPVSSSNEAMDRIIAREHQEVATIRHYTPIIETYIQEMKLDKDMGAVPSVDHYFLGQANLSRGVVDTSMLSRQKGKADQFNPLAHLGDFFFGSGFVPAGFLQMVYLDAYGFDRQHYQFEYVGREFLGGVRCFLFDVKPL